MLFILPYSRSADLPSTLDSPMYAILLTLSPSSDNAIARLRIFCDPVAGAKPIHGTARCRGKPWSHGRHASIEHYSPIRRFKRPRLPS